MRSYKSYFVKKLTKKKKTTRKKPRDENEEDENFDSPYLDQGGQNTPNSVYAYPGWGVEGRTLTSKPATFGEMADMTIGTSRPDFQKLLIVYPGIFQPFHLGHTKLFNKLKEMFPEASVYITTADKVDKDLAPFDYDDKLQMMVASGINPQDVIKSAQPFKAPELVNKYDKSSAKIIFALGKKDVQGPKAKVNFKPKKDGKPAYYQRFKSKDDLQPIDKHGYVVVLPYVLSKLSGKGSKTSKELIELYRRSNEKQRKQIITDLYGKFKPEMYSLFNKKLG
jgi:cytidyltransferase-like protein